MTYSFNYVTGTGISCKRQRYAVSAFKEFVVKCRDTNLNNEVTAPLHYDRINKTTGRQKTEQAKHVSALER